MAEQIKVEAWALVHKDGSVACFSGSKPHTNDAGVMDAGLTPVPLTGTYTPPEGVELPWFLEWAGEKRRGKPGEWVYVHVEGRCYAGIRRLDVERPDCHILRPRQARLDDEGRKLLERASDALCDYRLSLNDGLGASESNAECEADIDAYLAKTDTFSGIDAIGEKLEREGVLSPATPDRKTVERVVEMIGRALRKQTSTKIRYPYLRLFSDHSGDVAWDDILNNRNGVNIHEFTGTNAQSRSDSFADWIIANQPQETE